MSSFSLEITQRFDDSYCCRVVTNEGAILRDDPSLFSRARGVAPASSLLRIVERRITTEGLARLLVSGTWYMRGYHFDYLVWCRLIARVEILGSQKNLISFLVKQDRLSSTSSLHICWFIMFQSKAYYQLIESLNLVT